MHHGSDSSHTEDSPRACGAGAQWHKWQFSCTHTQTRTLTYCVLRSHPPPPSSLFTLFYISVTSAFLPCSPCQLPFHALPQKCVRVNISRLLMLKGSGSGRYVTGRELSVPRACQLTNPRAPFLLLFQRLSLLSSA